MDEQDTTWMMRAACRGMRGFLVADLPQDATDLAFICNACAVQDHCLLYGIGTKSTGVWGGRWLVRGRMPAPKGPSASGKRAILRKTPRAAY